MSVLRRPPADAAIRADVLGALATGEKTRGELRANHVRGGARTAEIAAVLDALVAEGIVEALPPAKHRNGWTMRPYRLRTPTPEGRGGGR